MHFIILLVSIVLNIIYIPLNGQGMVDGPAPSVINLILSIVFLLIYFTIGFLSGKKALIKNVIYLSILWGLGLISIIYCFVVTVTPIWLVALTFLAPINGFGSGNGKGIILVFLPVAALWIGYLMNRERGI